MQPVLSTEGLLSVGAPYRFGDLEKFKDAPI
jgi:hypothetical protein